MKLEILSELYLCITSYEDGGKSQFTAGKVYVSTRKDEEKSMMLECIDDNGDLNAFGIKNFVRVGRIVESPLKVKIDDELLYIGRDVATNNFLKLSFGSKYRCRGVNNGLSIIYVNNDVNEIQSVRSQLFIPHPTLLSKNTDLSKEKDSPEIEDFKYNVYYIEGCSDKSISFDTKEDAATWCGNFLTTAENDKDNYIIRVVYGKEVPFTPKTTVEVNLG